MSLKDAIRQSGLHSIIRMIGGYTLATETSSDGRLRIYFSNGDCIFSADLGEKEIDEFQAKLGLNNRQGVLNLIAAALKDLQQPGSTSGALSLPLARGSQREAELRLGQPANQSEAKRLFVLLVSARACQLTLELEAANRTVDELRSFQQRGAGGGMVAQALGALAGAGNSNANRRVQRTALPGMSLVNPMQRKRKAAKGVVFDSDSSGSGEASDPEQEAAGGSGGDRRRSGGRK